MSIPLDLIEDVYSGRNNFTINTTMKTRKKLKFSVRNSELWVKKIRELQKIMPYGVDKDKENQFEGDLHSFLLPPGHRDIKSEKKSSYKHKTFQVINCPSCNRSIPIDSVVCPFCRRGLEPESLEKGSEELYDQKHCPSCGRSIPIDSIVCPYCKRDFQKKKLKEQISSKIQKLSQGREEWRKKLAKLENQKDTMTKEEYKKRYEEIMDKLVDIEDMIIQEKIKEGVKK